MSKRRMQETDPVIWDLDSTMKIQGFFGSVQKDQREELKFFARDGRIKVGTLGTKTFVAAYHGAEPILESIEEQQAFLEKAARWYEDEVPR